MARFGVIAVGLFALLLGGACAQVLGIGNPDTCQDGTEYCDGECVDLTRDQANCGECGKSCKGASCVDSLCVDTDCNREFAQCVNPMSGSTECHGLDCVEFAAITAPRCLRRCETNDDCPFDYFCAPKGDTAYAAGFYQFVLAGGHCVPSYCGGVAGTWYANGTANGPCRVGGDGYLKQGAAVDKAGTCLVSSKTGPGVCAEAGRVQVNQTCTFETTGCVERAAYLACTDGHACLGTAGAATGTCYQVCDPKTTGQCPSGQKCSDKSGGNQTLGACEY